MCVVGVCVVVCVVGVCWVVCVVGVCWVVCVVVCVVFGVVAGCGCVCGCVCGCWCARDMISFFILPKTKSSCFCLFFPRWSPVPMGRCILGNQNKS